MVWGSVMFSMRKKLVTETKILLAQNGSIAYAVPFACTISLSLLEHHALFFYFVSKPGVLSIREFV